MTNPPDRQSPDSASVTPIDPTATPIDPTATPEDPSAEPTAPAASGDPVGSSTPQNPAAETAPPAAAPVAADAVGGDGLLSPLSDASDLVVPDAPRAPERGDALDAGTFPTLREPRSDRRISIGDGTWHKISPKYVVSQFISGGIIVVLVAAAMITVALTTGQWWPWLVGGALLVLTVLPLVILPRQARAYGYQLRSDDIVFRRGILWQRFVAVPYGRLQLVDITHGPLDRAFKIAQLKLVTAAASTGVTIPGLTQDAAEALRDTLIDVAETRRTGL